MIMLAEHYETSGQDKKARECRNRLLELVQKTAER